MIANLKKKTNPNCKEAQQSDTKIVHNTVSKGLAVAHYWGLILDFCKSVPEAVALEVYAFYSKK